jgi:hypothetical protein
MNASTCLGAVEGRVISLDLFDIFNSISEFGGSTAAKRLFLRHQSIQFALFYSGKMLAMFDFPTGALCAHFVAFSLSSASFHPDLESDTSPYMSLIMILSI